MNVDSWAVVFATLLGPLLALEAQRRISLWREHRNRKLAIFRTLMATRANVVSPDAVNAFNAIPVEFYGDEDVLGPWRIYFDHLETKMDPTLWADKRWDLYTNLLLAMSGHLAYSFDPVTIKKKIYAPEAHGKLMSDQEVIRQAVRDLVTGKGTLPMEVRSFPTDPEGAKRLNALHAALLEWLTGKITPSVKVEQPKQP